MAHQRQFLYVHASRWCRNLALSNGGGDSLPTSISWVLLERMDCVCRIWDSSEKVGYHVSRCFGRHCIIDDVVGSRMVTVRCCSAGWNGATLESYLTCLRAYVVETSNVCDGLQDRHFCWTIVAGSGSSNFEALARPTYHIFCHEHGGFTGLMLLSCREMVKSSCYRAEVVEVFDH